MSSLIKDMITVKEQLKILREAQELNVCAHASLCTTTKTKQTNKVVKSTPKSTAKTSYFNHGTI